MDYNKFARKLIRDYHSMLLNKAKMIRDIKEMIKKDDFMDINWKVGMARLFVAIETDVKRIAKTIQGIREQYERLEF